MKEVWKDIEGYEGKYKISNYGRVMSINYNLNGYKKILKNIINNGYVFVSLCKNGVPKQYRVHRLVAEAFIPNPNNYPIINHKDENPLNNRVDNLEWCTRLYNNTYNGIRNKSSEKCKKKINQYSLDGIFIKTWNSQTEIEENLGFRHGNISSCCLGRIKTSMGYIWKFKE